ncbi:phage minor head protein [Azospirillum thiophilum]|uniref:phage minor head protein n=1 Tax=Azospirillum thiophilum TaxID=528244 RepID=UPI0007C6B9FD|nr:phage minor head protein [Azospirillum thiophilum]
MAVPTLTPLPPEQAIRFLEAKGYRVGFSWKDVWQEEHAVAFTVAKMMEVDLLADVHRSLVAALNDGQSFDQWRKGLEPLLQARGWWGKAIDTDPLTGEEQVVQLGSPRRLKTIFDTNVRMSMAAGQWERIERLAPARPYLRYVAVKDERTRPEHLAWNGTILKVGHPWWDTHSPPCGWGCRCTLQQLSAKDLERNGWTETATPPPLDPRPWVNNRTGETVEVPAGVDPGFGYHKGKAAREAEAARQLMEKAAVLPPDMAVAAFNPQRWAGPLADSFATWYDGIDFNRPKGEVRVVGMLSHKVLNNLEAKGIVPESAAITVNDRDLQHAQRKAHELDGIMIPHDAMRRLPSHLANPSAILWDRNQDHLVYVFDAAPGGAKPTGKLVIHVDVSRKGRTTEGTRIRVVTNPLHTAYLVDPRALRDPGTFELIDGAI